MTYDGTYLWILAGVDKIYKFSTEGNLIDTINSAGSYPVGLAFNGEQLLNADSRWGNSKIFKLDLTGSSIVTAPIYGPMISVPGKFTNLMIRV
jgi:glutamine cyclotransferase